MARATKSNGFGRDNGFLSDVVSGDVIVENPDGVLKGADDMGPYSTSLRGRKYPLQPPALRERARTKGRPSNGPR